MSKISLKAMDGIFSIHRFPPGDVIPREVLESTFFTVSKTEDELSVVCDSAVQLDSRESSDHWSCFKVLGPLDFSLTGILAGISATFADSGISIFAISTFDTDYVLVPSGDQVDAINALRESGYFIEE